MLHNADNIGDIRQFIIDNSSDNHILMLDDDLRFCNASGSATLDEVADLFDEIEWLFNQGLYSMICVGLRVWSNGRPRYLQDKFSGQAFAIDLNVWDESWNMTGKWPVVEDRFIAMNYLTHGYRSLVISSITVDPAPMNIPGGCSIYRSPDQVNKCLRQLAKLFPNHFTLSDSFHKDGTIKHRTAWAKFTK
jgi:hypothetical protein